MSRRVVAFLFMVACAGKSEPAAAPSPAAPEPYTWNWSPPCTVPVRFHAHTPQPLVDMVIEAKVSVTSHGEDFIIEYPQHRILEINGVDATTPDMVARLEATPSHGEPSPAFLVDRSGGFIKMVSDEPPQPVAEDPAADLWASWVGSWRAWSGPANLDDCGLAYLHTESTIEGDEFVAYARDFLRVMGVDPDSIQGELTGSMQKSLSGVVEPVGLRTHHAASQYRIVLNVDGVEAVRFESLSEADFDWDHAEGCGK